MTESESPLKNPETVKEALECQKLRLDLDQAKAQSIDDSEKRKLEIAKLKRFDVPTWLTVIVSVLIAVGGWLIQHEREREADRYRDNIRRDELRQKVLDGLANSNSAQRLTAAAALVSETTRGKDSAERNLDSELLIHRLEIETDPVVAQQLISSVRFFGTNSVDMLAQANRVAFRTLAISAGRAYTLHMLKQFPDPEKWNSPGRNKQKLFDSGKYWIIQILFSLGIQGTRNEQSMETQKLMGIDSVINSKGKLMFDREVMLTCAKAETIEIYKELRTTLIELEHQADVVKWTTTAIVDQLRLLSGHLDNVNLSDTVLLSVDLTNLNLSKVNFRNSTLVGRAVNTIFDGGDLSEVDMKLLFMPHAKIRNSKLTDAHFGRIAEYHPDDCPDFTGSNWWDAWATTLEGVSRTPGWLAKKYPIPENTQILHWYE